MIARRKAKDRHGPSTYPMDVAKQYPGSGRERAVGRPRHGGGCARCGNLSSVDQTAGQRWWPATLRTGRAIFNGLIPRELSIVWTPRAVSALFLLGNGLPDSPPLEAGLMSHGRGGESAALAIGDWRWGGDFAGRMKQIDHGDRGWEAKPCGLAFPGSPRPRRWIVSPSPASAGGCPRFHP